MRAAVTAWIVASLLVPGAAPIGAQAPAKASAGGGPVVVAPAKPQVAPRAGPRNDSGAAPTAARSANARTLSLSARQAAEQTIAALVAAMKNMPKRSPEPAESRTPRARRGAAAQALDTPPPILYRVTWPATPDEPFVTRRVDLDWPGQSTGGPVSLRWNEPAAD